MFVAAREICSDFGMRNCGVFLSFVRAWLLWRQELIFHIFLPSSFGFVRVFSPRTYLMNVGEYSERNRLVPAAADFCLISGIHRIILFQEGSRRRTDCVSCTYVYAFKLEPLAWLIDWMNGLFLVTDAVASGIFPLFPRIFLPRIYFPHFIIDRYWPFTLPNYSPPSSYSVNWYACISEGTQWSMHNQWVGK